VRHYSTPESALKALAGFEKAGKPVRAVYAHDRNSGIKLLANLAWFVKGDKGQIDAFLLKGDAEAYAKAKGGAVVDYAAGKAAAAS
jgi:NitT/TauT family transport system substrate-binding protein